MSKIEKITHIAINAQVLLNRLHDQTAGNVFKQVLKHKAKNFIDELIKVEKTLYNGFFEAKEESAVQVYEVYDNFISDVASVAIYDMENISKIIQAYKKDPKSIEGIVNKILKN